MTRAPLASLLAAPLLAAAVLAAPAAGAETAATSAVEGRVFGESAGLARATVYAFELAETNLRKVTSDGAGAFRFAELPAGLYKLVAFKSGFEPAVVMLSRTAGDAYQYVELRLESAAEGVRQAERYWTLREEIPPDVLRDIQASQLEEWSAPPSADSVAAMRTSVQAVTGFDDRGTGGGAQLAGGGIDMEGRIGPLEVGVAGTYLRLAGSSDFAAGAPDGEAARLALRMDGPVEGELDVTTVSHRLAAGTLEGRPDADFERYRLSWSQPVGEHSRSRFAAQYMAQSHFFHPGLTDAMALPAASRALHVEGAYQVEISDRASLETGVRYHQREAVLPAVALGEPERTLELFGSGGLRVEPRVLVEYGLYTQLQDGSLALAPQGNLVVQLGQHWQAGAAVSQRIEDDDRAGERFAAPVRFGRSGADCRELDAHCYRVTLARQGESDDDLFSVAAVHRELADTLQLYFSDDFFQQMESLYLVRGDELPEVQVALQRRVTPQILARLESSFADGGGGMVYAADQAPHENEVRYLVTSLDTQFRRSATGVFLAFHHLEQDLVPLAGAAGEEGALLDLERLQLMLSQDLNVLLSLASQWAVHLNFELSRGTLPYTLEGEPEDVRRRVTGGVSVKF